MKKIVIFLSFVYPLCGNAQTKLYVEPTVQLLKVGITSTSSITQTKLLAQPNGTQLETRSMRLSSPTIGVNIGASFAGGKRRLSLGVNMDNASFGYHSVGQAWTNSTTVKQEVAYAKWNLTFEQRLSEITKQHQWYVVAGIGAVFYHRNHSVNHGSSGYLQSTDTIGSRWEDYSSTVQGDLPFSPSFHIGLKTDFYSKKGAYLFSSSLFYTHGIDQVATMDIFHTAAVGSERIRTWNRIYSKGSGFTLQFSRRFSMQLHNKKKDTLK